MELESKQCVNAIYSAPEVNPTSCSIFSIPLTGKSYMGEVRAKVKRLHPLS